MIRSVIDLGTNTCLLLIVDWDDTLPGRLRSIVHDLSTIVRLGQGVDRARNFQPDAMERTYKALLKYATIVEESGSKPCETVCVATSQARDAKNSKEFFSRISNDIGFKFLVPFMWSTNIAF